MRIALDIDNTITQAPVIFKALSHAPEVTYCIIITSRSNTAETRKATIDELSRLGIRYQQLFLLENENHAKQICPHKELDWYQKYLWQKVDICIKEKIDVVFEDEQKVICLFKKYAPKIQVFEVHQ